MEKEKNRSMEYRDEIDLIEVFLKLKSCWKAIVLCGLLGTFVGILYATFLVKPMYNSTAMVYLRSTNTATLSLQDLQVGTQLTKDYEIIFKSRPILEETIQNLDLNMTPDALSNMITISNPEDSRILKITVQAEDPNLAKKIVNSIMDNGIDKVSEIDAQTPYVVEKGIANTQNVSVSKKKTGMLGGMLGIVVVAGYILIEYIVKDTVSSADDIERVLNVPVLAIVAEDETLHENKNRKKSTKKRGARS